MSTFFNNKQLQPTDEMLASALGEKAYLEIMKSDLPDSSKQQLSESKVYMEGRGLRLEIRNMTNAEPLWQLIRIKLNT